MCTFWQTRYFLDRSPVGVTTSVIHDSVFIEVVCDDGSVWTRWVTKYGVWEEGDPIPGTQRDIDQKQLKAIEKFNE